MNIENLVSKLPKAELHLHIEGSLEPELMFELAKRNNVKLKFNNVEEIRKAYDFSNLQTFLDIYYEGAKVLLYEQDFYDLTMEYLKRCREDNVRHTEIFFDPQTHTSRGVSFKTVITGINKALEDGKKKYDISSSIIMCFLRHLSEEEGFEVLEQSLPFKNFIIGVGLDSSEVGNPPKKFSSLFKKCREYGFKIVAHAGEEGPAQYVIDALDILKVDRIDHGVRSIEDESLMNRLIKDKIPLTVCPLSNLKLCVVNDLKDHNIKKMLERGVIVTINSDDPAYFGGYVNQNYISTAKALCLTKDQIFQLAKNSFTSSFLSKELKDLYISEINSLEENYE